MSRFIHNYAAGISGIFGNPCSPAPAAGLSPPERQKAGAAFLYTRRSRRCSGFSWIQALGCAGKVIPPTFTFTAAISRPVMDSTAFFTPSCTARPTSGMVWP